MTRPLLLIAALFDHLPPPGTDWPVEQQVAWLRAAEAIFRLVFEAEGRVEITAKETAP